MENLRPDISPWKIFVGLIGLWTLFELVRLVKTRYRPGLRQVPGLFLASISNLDRVWSCAKGLQMNYHLNLHKKYGPLVRIGPNHVSFSDARLIPQVYSISSKFYKSDFYKMFDIKAPAGQMPTIFSVRDETIHKGFKRQVAGAYSLSLLKELEPMNDACSAIFLQKMNGFVGEDIDLGVWVHWYAWDTISSITFSNRLGFMEQEKDINNIIAAIEGRLFYNSIVGQVPSLHAYLFGNSFVAWLGSFIPSVAILNSSKYIVAFTANQLERYQNKESNTGELQDMLARFKCIKDGELAMDDSELLSHASGNIFAGSDTTAASMRSIFYNLCRNQEAHRKLLDEIDNAEGKGELSDPVTFAEAQNLKYLQAVIKEALRMHPAVGLLLERVVPSGGAELGGVWLPEGTVVGMNPWVAARDKATYGDDADGFRPERWLEADEEHLKVMDRNFLAFGAGPRTCLGKNISLLEMSKLVPQVLRRFDYELTDQEKEWRLYDYWFVQQKGLITKVKRRHVE